jgi:uncharacterized protein YutE (UPF0331/DUF86 family)
MRNALSSGDSNGVIMVEERERLREMLADLETTLARLRDKQGVSKQAYEADRDRQDIVERRLERATQTCLDIARRICVLEERELGDTTNAATLAELVDMGVLPASHRQEFVDIAGLRNVLAHRYRHIDSEEIYETYHDLERLELFSESIYLYLQEAADEDTPDD